MGAAAASSSKSSPPAASQMGCSGSKKESPLDPSDVQLSGGDPLSQLSGGDPLSGDWSRSEQRRSSAADLDPSDAFRALDVSRGEADGADEPDGNSFKRRSKAGSARKSSFSKKKAPKLEKKKISFSDEAVDMETSEVAPTGVDRQTVGAATAAEADLPAHVSGTLAESEMVAMVSATRAVVGAMVVAEGGVAAEAAVARAAVARAAMRAVVSTAEAPEREATARAGAGEA